MGLLSKLFGGGSSAAKGTTEEQECHLYMLLSEPIKPSPEQMHAACERAWQHPFPGEPSEWFVMYHELIRDLWTIRFGRGSITASFIKSFVYEDDHSDHRKPHIRHRQLWPAHQSRMSLFMGPLPDPLNVPAQKALIARLALELLDDNCVGIYDSLEKRVIPNGPELVAELRARASHAPPNAAVN